MLQATREMAEQLTSLKIAHRLGSTSQGSHQVLLPLNVMACACGTSSPGHSLA